MHYGCMCTEVKEVCFLSFTELHENTYLLSLSASQKDLFLSALLHYCSAQKSLY